MAVMANTGGSITTDVSSHASTDTAILLEPLNRYKDSYGVFRLQATTGLQRNTKLITEQTLDTTNLMNANPVTTGTVTKAACVKLRVPQHIRRGYQKKIIPEGTQFDCIFVGGDITKTEIIKLHEDPNGAGSLGGKMNELR